MFERNVVVCDGSKLTWTLSTTKPMIPSHVGNDMRRHRYEEVQSALCPVTITTGLHRLGSVEKKRHAWPAGRSTNHTPSFSGKQRKLQLRSINQRWPLYTAYAETPLKASCVAKYWFTAK